MSSTNEWFDRFSPQQLRVLKYALIKADAFIREVNSTNDIDADKRTAFLAGFYLGYDFNGGELPPEPLDGDYTLNLVKKG